MRQINKDGMTIEQWADMMDEYLGRSIRRSQGRPLARLNEDLIIHMKNEGVSNRAIARVMGYDRRTVDRRVLRLRKQGYLER